MFGKPAVNESAPLGAPSVEPEETVLTPGLVDIRKSKEHPHSSGANSIVLETENYQRLDECGWRFMVTDKAPEGTEQSEMPELPPTKWKLVLYHQYPIGTPIALVDPVTGKLITGYTVLSQKDDIMVGPKDNAMIIKGCFAFPHGPVSKFFEAMRERQK